MAVRGEIVCLSRITV